MVEVTDGQLPKATHGETEVQVSFPIHLEQLAQMTP
jgi:hypothetical protein